MTLVDKKASEHVEDVKNNLSYLDSFEWNEADVRYAFKKGWDAALDWAVKNVKNNLTYQKGYEDANEVRRVIYLPDAARMGELDSVTINEESILLGKTIEA